MVIGLVYSATLTLALRVFPVGTVTFWSTKGKYMSTENSKPEWFHMAQADAFEPKPASKKVLRIMALATPLFVLGAGFAVAQSQGSPSAVASSAVAVQTSAVATATPVSAVATATPTNSPIRISQVASVGPAITIAKPAIKLPSGGGEDDISPSVLTSPNTSSTITKPGIATLPTGSGDDD